MQLLLGQSESLDLLRQDARKKGAREQTLAELSSSLRALPPVDRRLPGQTVIANTFQVERHKKLAIPLACLVFITLAVPIGMASSRHLPNA